MIIAVEAACLHPSARTLGTARHRAFCNYPHCQKREIEGLQCKCTFQNGLNLVMLKLRLCFLERWTLMVMLRVQQDDLKFCFPQILTMRIPTAPQTLTWSSWLSSPSLEMITKVGKFRLSINGKTSWTHKNKHYNKRLNRTKTFPNCKNSSMAISVKNFTIHSNNLDIQVLHFNIYYRA